MFVVDSLSGDSILLFITSLIIIIGYYYWFYGYWYRRDVPCLQSYFTSKEHLGIRFKHVYDQMKQQGWKHGGVFMQLSPIYVIGDLDLLKNIMTTDFRYFPHRGLYYNEKSDPLSCHIFNTSGAEWRNMRTKLNQIFTPVKLKLMFPFLLNCEAIFLKKVEHHERKALDIKKLSEGFISDVIECCAFGLDCRNFKNENSPFREFGRRIFKRSNMRRIKGFLVDNFPNLGKILNVALVPKDAASFFLKIVTDAVSYRKKNNLVRHDFIQVLIEDGGLSVEDIAAQCFIFFLAGMSTSPSAITFALYELAKNESIQEKVRREIEKKYQNTVTYEAIQEMKYLDKVFLETLRKYPPAAYLNRKCVKDYRISGTDVIIEKDTTVVIPILGIHHDPDYYPDPEKFDPERFSEGNKSLRHSYAHIPFGEGPRICIGMRFGLLQSKLALISLLRHFKFTVNQKTQEPLKMVASTLVLTAKGGIWLDAHKI